MNEVQSNKSKILVVEDDPITSLVIEKFLNSEFVIEHVLSGEAALEKVKQNSYDLILMDIGLNGKQLDGIQTLNLIRNIDGYKNIPIIAQTAFAMMVMTQNILPPGLMHTFLNPLLKMNY